MLFQLPGKRFVAYFTFYVLITLFQLNSLRKVISASLGIDLITSVTFTAINFVSNLALSPIISPTIEVRLLKTSLYTIIAAILILTMSIMFIMMENMNMPMIDDDIIWHAQIVTFIGFAKLLNILIFAPFAKSISYDAETDTATDDEFAPVDKSQAFSVKQLMFDKLVYVNTLGNYLEIVSGFVLIISSYVITRHPSNAFKHNLYFGSSSATIVIVCIWDLFLDCCYILGDPLYYVSSPTEDIDDAENMSMDLEAGRSEVSDNEIYGDDVVFWTPKEKCDNKDNNVAFIFYNKTEGNIEMLTKIKNNDPGQCVYVQFFEYDDRCYNVVKVSAVLSVGQLYTLEAYIKELIGATEI